MNELTALREAAPQPAPPTPTVRNAARAALLAEIEAEGRPAPARRRPARRRVWIRAGIGVTAVAAAWAAAAVIAAPGPDGKPASRVDLVAFAPPSFPFTLTPAPAGPDLTYSADPGGILHAGYTSSDGADSFAITVTPDERDLEDPSDSDDVTVQGRDAELVTENVVYGTDRGSEVVPRDVLVLEWSDDQWVTIGGEGVYATRARLVDLAERLTATPVDVGLQVSLAPAGWSVHAYKDDRILTLANDAAEQQTLSVSLPPEPIPADQLLAQLMDPVGPVVEVTVNDRPAHLVPVDTGYTGPGGGTGWYLQAQLNDGRTFVVQAPGALTQGQVLDLAAQVTYTP